METNIIKIGNSKGIIIPSELLKQLSLGESTSLSLTTDGDSIMLRAMNSSVSMLKTNFFLCPACGNIVHSSGPATVSCHGVALTPLKAQRMDDEEIVTLEKSDGEGLITIQSPQTKKDYISFVAIISPDRIQTIKLYPEGPAQARFRIEGTKAIYYYSTANGFFKVGTKLVAKLFK